MQKQSAKQTDPVHIKELKPDDKNLRAHNPRNIGMIADAMQEVGAARSIVIDEDGTILAGNGAVEAAGQAGITKVKVVDVDGETIVAVRRKGLTARQKKRLAAYDNRTAELATWDTDVMKDLLAQDAEVLKGMFQDYELAMIGIAGDPNDPNAEWQGMPEFKNEPKAFRSLMVHFKTQADIDDFVRILGQSISAHTKYIWHPAQKKRDMKGISFISDSYDEKETTRKT